MARPDQTIHVRLRDLGYGARKPARRSLKCAGSQGLGPSSAVGSVRAQRSAESGMGTTSSCTPVSMLVSLRPCITTSAPILQLFAFNSSKEEMCQQVPSASVAMPPLFISLKVVFFGAMFALLAPRL